MSEENLVCVICKKGSSLKCARCQTVSYCSKEHQKKDWRIHKRSCALVSSQCYKIAVDKKVGRHLVSTQFIFPGEIVIQELPLVTGPIEYTPPVCLGCYKILNEFNHWKCTRCNWPMCSSECSGSATHLPECEITTKYKKDKVSITNFGVKHPTYQCITVLRCLYQHFVNGETWDKIIRLESHSRERKYAAKFRADAYMVSKFIPRFFNYDLFTEEEIFDMVGIVEVNAHHIPLQESAFVAIYNDSSFIEHSCYPNCSKAFTDTGRIIIRAARTIRKGEHLSISYTLPLWGRQARRDHLAYTKYFVCECIRCNDPMEFGTNFNSYKCLTPDCSGYLVPVKAHFPQKCNWLCRECDRFNTTDDLEFFFEHVRTAVKNVVKDDPKSCKQFLRKYKKFLHKNHHFMVEIELALLRYYEDERLLTATIEDLNHMVEICERLIDLTAKLVPSETRLRGVLHFRLSATLSELRRRKSLSGDMDESQLMSSLAICKDLLNKTYSLLRLEPDSMPEGQIANEARMQMSQIDRFIEIL